MAELERLDTHVLWAGIADKLMGFKTMFMICFALREKAMEVPRAISGNCVNGSMDCIGGVNRDLADRGAVLAAVEQLEREMGLFGERNKTQPGLQMGDLIEKRMLDGFHTVPTGRGLLLNSDPGLRCACPGLLSLLPSGERRFRRCFIPRGSAKPVDDWLAARRRPVRNR